MAQNSKGFRMWYATSFAVQLGFLIAIPIIGFILLGLWLDRLIHTFPLFIIAGMLGGIALSGYEIYHLLLPLIKNND